MFVLWFKTIFYTSFSDPDIRYCVLISLDERFDAHLAQAENLAALFVALSDEVSGQYERKIIVNEWINKWKNE